MHAALLQMCASDDPAKNTQTLVDAVAQAAEGGADILLTPEVSNCVSTSRKHQASVLSHEDADQTLAAMRHEAARHGIWVLIGSLALKIRDPDGRFANRSFLISPGGEVQAKYDKIHMFDVTLSDTESYRESSGYRPGGTAAVTQMDNVRVGMTICYDLRFPQLYRDLAQAGAQVITIPSAFSVPTGQAHWEVLLRARAIETGAFVLAPAQTGTHPASTGKPRKTFGHSMAIAPWGEVLLDAGTDVGLSFVDLDLSQVEDARRRVPSLSHDRVFRGPDEH